MCLYNAKWVLDHQDDIICYKVLSPIDNTFKNFQNLETLTCPQVTYTIGKTNSIDYKRRKTSVIKCDLSNKETPYVTDGAYHSFVTIKDAIEYSKKNIWLDKYIVKCIIPKNSAYIFKGDCLKVNSWTYLSGDHKTYILNAYASQKIKPIEIVAEVETHHGKSKITYLNK